VLHVLAHVDAGNLAASCHDRGWIAWAEAKLGRATDRALGDDARILAEVLGSHDALVAAHALAWTFEDQAQVRAARARDLAQLGDHDVADPKALALARAAGPAVEVLRAAAELELPLLASLAPVRTSSMERGAERNVLVDALEDVASAAPGLSGARVALARPLPRRGRAWRGAILVGAPGVAGAEVSHVAWQAAHEATVLEVERSASWLTQQVAHARSFEAVERTALGLLRSRARRVGLADAHGRWLATLDLRALGPIPDVDDTD
jgi:hypothetical protein